MQRHRTLGRKFDESGNGVMPASAVRAAMRATPLRRWWGDPTSSPARIAPLNLPDRLTSRNLSLSIASNP
jgi:hypothetical protein